MIAKMDNFYRNFPKILDWNGLRASNEAWRDLIIDCPDIGAAMKHIGSSVSYVAAPFSPVAVDATLGVVFSFAESGNLVICPTLMGDYPDLVGPLLFKSQFVIVPPVPEWDFSIDVWNATLAHLAAGKQVIMLGGLF